MARRARGADTVTASAHAPDKASVRLCLHAGGRGKGGHFVDLTGLIGKTRINECTSDGFRVIL